MRWVHSRKEEPLECVGDWMRCWRRQKMRSFKKCCLIQFVPLYFPFSFDQSCSFKWKTREEVCLSLKRATLNWGRHFCSIGKSLDNIWPMRVAHKHQKPQWSNGKDKNTLFIWLLYSRAGHGNFIEVAPFTFYNQALKKRHILMLSTFPKDIVDVKKEYFSRNLPLMYPEQKRDNNLVQKGFIHPCWE